MIKQNITVDEVVEYLNELIKIDKQAIEALIGYRVPCNRKLADHPSVQVADGDDGYYVGMLGIINGMFGTSDDGYGAITFVFGSDGRIKEVITL